MMDGKVILIEGLDLAGKTTLVRSLRDELTRRGVTVRVSRNALCPENPIAPIADALRRDPQASLEETGNLFLASHLWDARNFRRPPEGTIHLQDSCWLRTLAFHSAKDTPMIPMILRELIPKFPCFDLAFFLTTSISERQRRLIQREHEIPGSNDFGDQAVVFSPEMFMYMEGILKDLATELVGAIIVDTTDSLQSDLLERVTLAIVDSG